MALKTKQYLENSWYRWASQDRQTWYAAQYQYGYGVNTRDMKNWVCLAWWATDVTTKNKVFYYFTYASKLYYVDKDWNIYDSTWTQKCATWISWTNLWIEFGWYIFIIWTGWVAYVDNTWTSTNITSSFSWWANTWTCALNYANTFLLIWDWNLVWKVDMATWTPVPKIIRNFQLPTNVFGLTQEWNYLKIYTSDWINTKIHYAKWTFDVEYTWLVQTVSFPWLSINKWDITSDQWNDYAIFAAKTWEYKLAKISWYSKTDIKWTQTLWWVKIFTASNPTITASDWIVFAAMEDWIWTFIEYNWWLWWWCCEFPIKSTEIVYNMLRYEEYLYACVYDSETEKYTERYYDLSFQPATYQPNWFLIGRVYDWWCWSLFKKNVQATITYNMPTDTDMELSYRYDRSSFSYDKSSFLSIKKLTDTSNCYDLVFPTTPSTKEQDLLALENWDNILLENGNNILLEDLMICPFNQTWNYLEYRMDLSTNDTTKTPILFEHSLLYDDRIRKYR